MASPSKHAKGVCQRFRLLRDLVGRPKCARSVADTRIWTLMGAREREAVLLDLSQDLSCEKDMLWPSSGLAQAFELQAS